LLVFPAKSWVKIKRRTKKNAQDDDAIKVRAGVQFSYDQSGTIDLNQVFTASSSFAAYVVVPFYLIDFTALTTL
jgi:hypothetical protein